MSKLNIPTVLKFYHAFKVTARARINNFSKQDNLITRAFDKYEELLGIKEVRLSQKSVLQAESEFIVSSRHRREIHAQLSQVQEQLKQVRQKLDTVHRGDEAYLELITSEHKLIRSETKLCNDLKEQEDIEREYFSTFSQRLRDSQEVERLRQEKTKYLSLIGSVIGALLGIIATSINNAMRMRDVNKFLNAIRTQQDIISSNAVIEGPNNTNIVMAQSNDQMEKLKTEKELMEEQKIKLGEEILKRNTELSNLIHETESNLEYKMKINSLATVAITYALIAVTVPLLIKFFGVD